MTQYEQVQAEIYSRNETIAQMARIARNMAETGNQPYTIADAMAKPWNWLEYDYDYDTLTDEEKEIVNRDGGIIRK